MAIKSPEIIVAYDNNRAIGYRGELPWPWGSLPADMKRFKSITTGGIVVMGRRTFEGIGGPLPDRENIVLSSSRSLQISGCSVRNEIDEVLDEFSHDDRRIFIIGGSAVYAAGLLVATRIHATEVMAEFPADTFFPVLDSSLWHEAEREDHTADEFNKYAYSFVTLEANEVR